MVDAAIAYMIPLNLRCTLLRCDLMAIISPSPRRRRSLVKAWGISPGSKVLEIGPGQGGFTVILADAVGPTGQVVTVDPAPLDWGTLISQR